MSKFNDIACILFLAWHVGTRQWPMGDTFQTVMDILFISIAGLIVFKYYVLYKRKKDQGAIKENKRKARIPARNKRRKKS